MAALLPFGKVAELLGELLPSSAKEAVITVRNRTMKVGKRLEKSAEAVAASAIHEPCEEAIVGLDGGYVSARHRRPERNFEIVAGKVLDVRETQRVLLLCAMEVPKRPVWRSSGAE